MAFKLRNRVRETSTTTGTGAYALAGAVTGRKAVSAALGDTETGFFLSEMGANWEVFLGTYASGANTLARTTVYKSTNGDAAVNWGAGVKRIAMIDVAPTDLDATGLALLLGAMTAAGVNIANTFTLGQIISLAAAGNALTLKITDNGSTGVVFETYVDSASPAASDVLRDDYIYGEDSAGNKQLYGRAYWYIVSPTSGSEGTGYLFDTFFAGVQTRQYQIYNGIVIGAATGGLPGTGYINAEGYEINGVAQQDTNTSATVTFGGITVASFILTGSSLTPYQLISTDAGASAGPWLSIQRQSASPADGDLGPAIRMYGYNSAAAAYEAFRLLVTFVDITDATEDSTVGFSTMVAGTFSTRFALGGGIYMTGATGADKGAGTVNATAVYDDNVLLTCAAMQTAFIERGPEYVLGGNFLAEWDAKVPPTVEPARIERKPVNERFMVLRRELVRDEKREPVRDADGNFVSRVVEVEQQRPVVDLVPVYDEDGVTGVDAIEVPVEEVIEHPEKITHRPHHAARVFQRMVADGFDPRDPRNYVARLERDHQLPGMPTEADSSAGKWEHNVLSVGELKSRMWLALEFLALAFRSLVAEHDALVARVEALEGARRR